VDAGAGSDDRPKKRFKAPVKPPSLLDSVFAGVEEELDVALLADI
jgi:hypothetical protein